MTRTIVLSFALERLPSLHVLAIGGVLTAIGTLLRSVIDDREPRPGEHHVQCLPQLVVLHFKSQGPALLRLQRYFSLFILWISAVWLGTGGALWSFKEIGEYL
jgi:hypothetical protein